MILHALGIVVAVAFLILCTLLPFLPGRYDGLAIPLSVMAQAAGIVGLVLIPCGVLLIAANRSPKLAQWRPALSFIALLLSSLVWLAVLLAAIINSGFALGFVVLVLWVIVARKAWLSIRLMKTSGSDRAGVVGYYLAVVPVAVVVLQFALLGAAVEYSRNQAIQNSAPLLEEIEQYRARHGRYPASLLSVNPDYSPNVMGIEKYQYEPHNDGYNFFFEQFTYRFGTREFVMYNPRGEHVMTSHALDLLQLTPPQLALERTRGHYALNDSAHQHWKYFWFD